MIIGLKVYFFSLGRSELEKDDFAAKCCLCILRARVFYTLVDFALQHCPNNGICCLLLGGRRDLSEIIYFFKRVYQRQIVDDAYVVLRRLKLPGSAFTLPPSSTSPSVFGCSELRTGLPCALSMTENNRDRNTVDLLLRFVFYQLLRTLDFLHCELLL